MKTDKKILGRVDPNILKDPPFASSHVTKPSNNPKNLKVKKKQSPFTTQKHFAPNSFINSKNLNFKSEILEKENHYEAQGGPITQENPTFFSELDDPKAFLTSENNPNQLSNSGTFGRLNTLPIFKLLKVFKLQQYAKIMAELGYAKEIYKLSLISENQRFNLLSKINLMPGHRAKFLNFFEAIHKAKPQDENKKSLPRNERKYVFGKSV